MELHDSSKPLTSDVKVIDLRRLSVSMLVGGFIFNLVWSLERSSGPMEAQVERRSVSEACRRDRAALVGRESTYSTVLGINRGGAFVVGCQERRGIDYVLYSIQL